MKSNKNLAYQMVVAKLNGESFLSYKEISEICGYHEKYLLKLKKEILEKTFKLEHGNKNKPAWNKTPSEEKKIILGLYGKTGKISIRKFSKFYNKKSYSYIYKLIKNEK